MGQYISCSWAPRKSVSGGRQVLYGVRIEFNTLTKLVTLIKMCLNSVWPETKRVYICCHAFELCFRMCYYEDKKNALIRYKWNALVCS